MATLEPAYGVFPVAGTLPRVRNSQLNVFGDALPPAYGESYEPSLELQFAIKKTLDPRITFTRASSGTYWDSDGVLQTASTDVARFTHNPFTLESLGLLIEESRTNLLTYSEEFDNAAWTRIQCTVSPNAAAAPNGTITADKLIEDTTTNARDIRQTLSSGAGTYTASCFAEYSGRVFRMVVLCNSSASFVYCDFDLQSGIIGTPIVSDASVSAISASIEDAGGGIYRCNITATYATALTLMLLRIVPSLNYSAGASYPGDGTSGIYIWGAQLEAASTASSYIKTVASTATRAADNASMTGSNFSDWYNQAEGCFVALGRGSLVSGGAPVIAEASDGTTNNLLEMYRDSLAQGGFYVGSGGPQVANILVANGFPDNLSGSMAASYESGYFSQASNGVLGIPVSSGSLPIGIDRLIIGASITGSASNNWNGTIASIAYYPKRLSNSYLQYLSS